MEKVQLAHLINSYYQGYDSAERESLEFQLTQLEQDSDNHLQNVLSLILDNQSQEIASVKVTIAIYLRNYVRKLLNRSLADIEASYLQKLMDVFYLALISNQVEFTVKKHLFLVFESILQIYQSTEPNSQNIQSFYSTLFGSIQNYINQRDVEVTKGVLLVCQAALLNIRPLSLLIKVFNGLATLMCNLADYYISLLSKDLMVISSSPSTALTVDNPQIQSILSSLDLLQQWVNVHQSVLEKFQSKKYYAFQLFSQSESYSMTLTSIMGILVQSPQQDMKCFISYTGIEKLDQLLNNVKIKTLECLNSIFTYVLEEIPSQSKKESIFLAKAAQLCPFIVETLISIAERPEIQQIILDETFQDIIVETLESLALFTGESELYEVVFPKSKDVIVRVCLNLMRTTQSEYEQMIKDPEQFVALALDTCDKQKSRVVKTQAAKLLEAYCDNIDGATSFVTLFCCQSLSLALDESKPQLDHSFAQDYLKYQETLFLKSPQEIIGETCLMALTAISYILPRRQDLVPLFEKVLADNIDQILSKGSILLRVRMSLLLGYYADMLFSQYKEAFVKTIDFLIESIGLNKEQKVIAIQSADTLNTIISDKDLIPRLSAEVPRLILTLQELNLKIHIPLYFNFVLDFVKYYHTKISNLVVPFLQSLVQRILLELKSCHDKGEKNNIVINKCWNIIRQIIELPTFIPPFYDEIEDQLKPLFEFLVDPMQVEFEDDIILVLRSFIKKKQAVSLNLWTIFPHLIKVFEKNKQAFGNLLDTLNFYLIFGKQQIAANPDYLGMLFEIGKASLFSMQPNITAQNSEGAILFQLLFQVYAETQVLDSYFEQILNLVVKRLQSLPMAEHLKRHLLCVFLTAMAYNPNLTLLYLENNQSTEQLFRQIFQLRDGFQNIYERKVFIVGLSSVLNAQQMPPSIVQNLLTVFQQIIKMLNTLKETERKALQKASKKEINEEDEYYDEDSDEEEDDDDDDDDEEDEDEESDHEHMHDGHVHGEPTVASQSHLAEEEKKQEDGTKAKNKANVDTDDSDEEEEDLDEVFDLNVTMDMLSAPFKKIDEFQFFNKTLHNLHNKEPDYINNLVGQLSEPERKYLQEHMQTKRVEIEQKGVKTEVARRFITVKRRGGVGSGAAGNANKQ